MRRAPRELRDIALVRGDTPLITTAQGSSHTDAGVA